MKASTLKKQQEAAIEAQKNRKPIMLTNQQVVDTARETMKKLAANPRRSAVLPAEMVPHAKEVKQAASGFYIPQRAVVDTRTENVPARNKNM